MKMKIVEMMILSAKPIMKIHKNFATTENHGIFISIGLQTLIISFVPVFHSQIKIFQLYINIWENKLLFYHVPNNSAMKNI